MERCFTFMVIKNLHLCTKLEIWQPRYSSAYTDTNERVALLAKYKVDNSSPIIIINFTKAKHLAGQRFCISREEAMKAPLDTNGKIPCYSIRMSQLQPWQTPEEELQQVKDTLKELNW